MKKLLALLTSVASFSAMADQIELKNGDVIGGTLKTVNADDITWAADSVGEVTIKKGDVKDLNLTKPVKLQGYDEPCLWDEMIGEKASFTCDGEPKSYSLKTLEDVVLFESHEDALHAYDGKVTLLGSEKSGNVNSSDWLAGLQINLRHYDFRHLFELRYTSKSLEVESTDADGEVTKEDEVYEYYLGMYNINWFFMPRWYLLGNLKTESDDAKLIQERYEAGLGAGFQWWETDKTALKLELSSVQTKEHFELTPDEILDGQEDSKDYASGRFSADYRYKFPRDVAFFMRRYVTQSFDDSDDWRGRGETGVSAPLGLGISAHLNADYDYNNNPQEGVEKGDTTYRVGVVYSW